MIKYSYAQICDLVKHGYEPEGYDIVYHGLKPGSLTIDKCLDAGSFEIKNGNVPAPSSIYIKGKIDVMDGIRCGLPYYLKQEKMDFGAVTVKTAFIVEKLELNYPNDKVSAVNEWFMRPVRKKKDVAFDMTVRVKGADIDIYNVIPVGVTYPELSYCEVGAGNDLARVDTVNDFVHIELKGE